MNPFRFFTIAALLAASLGLASGRTFAADATMTDDPYLWLEDVTGDRALEWARARNAEALAALQTRPDYQASYERMLAMLDSRDRIPYVARHGDWFYNLWQDATNKRGLLRRVRLADYRKAVVPWEPVLDLDALGAAEKENWTWKGMKCLGPENRHCAVELSRGGADATVVREFDLVDKRFVEGPKAFVLPEAKSDFVWIDADNAYVETDFGPGTLTDSGYARLIKRWKRGTPLSEAVTVLEATPRDVGVGVQIDRTPGWERTLLHVSVDIRHGRDYLLKEGKRTLIDVPDDARVGFMRDAMLVELNSDWTTGGKRYPSGSLLATDADAFLAGGREMTVLFTPTPTRSLEAWSRTRDHVLLKVLDNVASKLEELKKDGPRFTRRAVAAPFPGTLGIGPLYDPELDGVPAEKGRPAVPAKGDGSLAERYWLTYVDFLTADSLALGTAGSDQREAVKSRPALFDAAGLHVDQLFATSKDGTKVPYFVVWPKGRSAENPGDGQAPTLLYGYGGFEVSQAPFYSGPWGSEWYTQGGVFVLANIRGGGEFGPAWHQAAQKANKQKSYDDFIAVAEDLIARKITTPRHLGIQGGSNGGLLVGAVMLQRPDLFNAVVCQQPLLDMKRYHKLLAGASWMGEYGDPDVPAEWAWISRYSPYQNVKPGVKYPSVLFTTSTRDDRVHPGHARKMAALMKAEGHDVLIYENIEGGHAGSADNEQQARMRALGYAYLRRQLY